MVEVVGRETDMMKLRCFSKIIFRNTSTYESAITFCKVKNSVSKEHYHLHSDSCFHVIIWSWYLILKPIFVIAYKYQILNTPTTRFIIRMLCWTLSIVRSIFDIHDVSVVVSTPVFIWLVVTRLAILLLLFILVATVGTESMTFWILC